MIDVATQRLRAAWNRARPVLTSATARRIYVALAVLLILFLWGNMVRRALQGGGSQYEEFVSFSRDLIYQGINIYREYPADYTITKYPPFFGLLFAPLVPLPAALGASVWFLLNLGLAAIATWVSLRAVDERPADAGHRPLGFFLIPFILMSGIIGSNLETAQVNIVIVCLLCVALLAFRRGRDLESGLVLGLVTALKLTPGLFILYFAYKRAWRTVLGAAVGLAVCWLLIPPLVLGFGDFVEVTGGWLGAVSPFVAEGTLAEGVQGFRHTNQSLSAALHRFFTETPAGAGRRDFYLNVASLSYVTMDRIVKGLSLGILALLAWLCRTPTGDRARIGLAFEYSLVMIATLFISPISWINHYVILIFPFVAGVYYVKTRPDDLTARNVVLWTLAAAFVLVSSSAARLPQAFSLPFLGALIFFVGLSIAKRREGAEFSEESAMAIAPVDRTR